MIKRDLYLILLLIILHACDVFEYHPYDTKLGNEYENINKREIEKIKNKSSSGTFKFA